MDVNRALEELVAERAIHRVLTQYCRGLDRKDWDMVAGVYHEGATDDHGPYSGPWEGFLDFLKERHKNVGSSMHVLGSVTVDFSADLKRAASEAYCLAYQHILPSATDPFAGDAGDAGAWVTIGCRYADVLEDREGVGWRIADRTVVHEWTRYEDPARYMDLPADWPQFQRDPSDPIFSALAKI